MPGSPSSSTAAAAPKTAIHEAQWIWSPAADEHPKSSVPLGTCYFRRSFEMTQPEAGEVQITADESYELYVNGRKVGEGHNWHVMDVHDITRFLKAGHNTIAVLANKTDFGPAGLAARVLVKSAGDTWVSYLTGSSWKTSQKEFVGWAQTRFNETQWLPAREIGQFGVVKPWLDEMQLAHGLGSRFKISEEFRVEAVVSSQDTGSLIAMAFNEFGDILASREGGPLLIVRPAKAGLPPSKVSVYCDQVKSIQGILPLNGQVFVVGAGPQGTGLYRISEPGTAPLATPPNETNPTAAAPNAPAPTAAAPATLPVDKPSGATSAPSPAASIPSSSRRGPSSPSAQNSRPHSDSGVILASAVVEATDEEPAAANISELKPLKELPDDNHEKLVAPPHKATVVRAKQVDLVLKFTGEMAEHGPHAPVLGPDGLIYVLMGDHSKPVHADDPASPYHHPYEGDLISPRYEDPNGYGVGVKAPGGRIIRTDASGSFFETFAAGFRNPYGFAFTRTGELITHESDMEWDVGEPWYRPTRLLHVVAGGDYGWRSGWGAWPTYFYDSLPSIGETGRSSPTAVVAYNHMMFPRRFQNTLFVGDWSRGRILNVRLKPSGASYTAESSVFLEGKPLNVTYLAIGPDGALYFCTGGRDTEGGIYRIVWNGKVPESALPVREGMRAAIQQPQLDSAWARQRVAVIKQKLGAAWDAELPTIANNDKNRPESRCRALELMQLLGPFPGSAELLRLSRDPDDSVRAKAVYLMGIHADEATGARLVELLRDPNPLVQRVACESLVRAGQRATWADLVPLLVSQDRYVSYAATRALEQIPKEGWQAAALAAKNQRLFLQGALALVVMDPDRATVDAILARVQKTLDGYVTDPDFLDLLRLTELALERGKLMPSDVPTLGARLANEYPAGDRVMNRELIRLMAFLKEPSANARMIQQLQDPDLPAEEKLHLALMARFIPNWTTSQKFALLKFYESARSLPGGHSFTGYVENVSRDFFVSLTDDERAQVLTQGTKWPSSALSVLAKLPDDPGAETLAQLQSLDRNLESMSGEPVRRLRIGIVAVLGHSGNAAAQAYLRELYDRDPERRGFIAMSLAEHPNGDNWPVLVKSLSIVEGAFAQQVLLKLASVDRKPQGSEPMRQAILCGLKLGDNGGKLAVPLLERWAGKKLSFAEDKWDTALAAWQAWFASKYPDQPEAKLPQDSNANRWTMEELLSYLSSPEGSAGDAQQGATVFEKANCVKCHRFGERGEGVGPDLTNVSRRFQKKEILESILFPSQVISDQYASKTIVLTDGRIIWGLASTQPDGSIVVLQSNTQRITIAKDEVDEIRASKKSAMPEGLMNALTLEEIADLFAYLEQSPDAKISNRRTQAER
ncbi:MAG TPA: HEAT repeat domain-containing protein [Pirellulales bacterium]|nr:HEAT repeat domain-containing protein [Pirellulales bacterium]